jgi:hypothetical protein
MLDLNIVGNVAL